VAFSTAGQSLACPFRCFERVLQKQTADSEEVTFHIRAVRSIYWYGRSQQQVSDAKQSDKDAALTI